MTSFYQNLLLSDQGFLRLKQASKTIFALLITIAILKDFPLIAQISACMVTGFGMQCAFGVEKKIQMQNSIIAFTSLICCYTLGMVCKPHPWLSTYALTIGAFFAFYVQRFGTGYLLTALFSWSMIFLGTVFPLNTLAGIEQNILASIISCIIAFMINFFIWPREPQKLFFHNLQNYFLLSQNILQLLIQLYYYGLKGQDANQYLHAEAIKLRYSLLLNQTLIEHIDEHNKDTVHPLKLIFIEQFSLGKALGMLLEVRDQLAASHQTLSPEMSKLILHLLQLFSIEFKQIKISSKRKKIILDPKSCKLIEEKLQELKQVICSCDDSQSRFIYLINLHLGLRYLLKSLVALGTNHEA